MKGFIALIVTVFMFTSSLAFGGGKIQKKGNDTYFELGGRYSKNDNMNLKTDSSGYDTDMKSNNGFGLSGEIGKRFGKNFRMGAEFAYRQAKLNGQVRQTENPLEGSVSLNEHETPGVADHEETVIDDHNPPNVADHEDTTVDDHGDTTVADHSDTTVADHGATTGITIVSEESNRQTRTYFYRENGKKITITEFRGGGGAHVINREETTYETPTGITDTTAAELANLKSITVWADRFNIEKHWTRNADRVAHNEERTSSKGVVELCSKPSEGQNPPGTCSNYSLAHTHRFTFGGKSNVNLSVNINEDLEHDVTTDNEHDVTSDGEHTVNSDGEHEITFNGEHSHSEDLDHEVTFNGMHNVNFDNFMENKDVDFGSRYLTTKSIMLNAYYDFDGLAGVTPWVGAGAGTTWANLADSAAFSYQLMAGIDMAVTDTTSLVLGYNWFQTQDIEMETRNIRGTVTDWKAEVGGHEVKLGVKFWF